jgi:hypothetical protein
VFVQGAAELVGQAEGGGADAGRRALRSEMFDIPPPESDRTPGIEPCSSSLWVRLPGCSMHASFCALDTFQDMHIDAAVAGSSSAADAKRSQQSDDGNSNRWSRFGHWNAPRCAVMGAGSRGVCGGVCMHHVEVAQALLLGAWDIRDQKTEQGLVSHTNLHAVARGIGFDAGTVRAFMWHAKLCFHRNVTSVSCAVNATQAVVVERSVDWVAEGLRLCLNC